MDYVMLKNKGALQEMPKQSFDDAMYHQECVDEDEIDDYVDMHQTQVNLAAAPVMGTQRGFVQKPREYKNYVDLHDSEVDLPTMATTRLSPVAQFVPESGLDVSEYEEIGGMFSYVIPEGQKVLMTDKHGRGTLLEGPQKVRRMGKKFQKLQHYVAYPGEFLIVRTRDGSQFHYPGPKEQWFDPRVHSKIEKSDALQIASKELIVVYSKGEENIVKRRMVNGPAMFVPEPGEWLHTFCWHGSKGDGYKKVPGGLVFQKLWLMPDQMYHDVEDVRTADDVLLTIKLMIFFELFDVEKMLEETHDPVGDFINATSSDVIDLVGRYSFDDFKQHTERLNDLKSYSQLLGRAEQVGYKIHKIVYRGYSTTNALQAMHEQAIETRTRLKLDRETEEQAQSLADFKQNREYERANIARTEQKEQEKHELERHKWRNQQDMALLEEKSHLKRKINDEENKQKVLHQRQKDEQQIEFLQKLQAMNVDLTKFLTQSRADQVIELRGKTNAPHLHLTDPGKK